MDIDRANSSPRKIVEARLVGSLGDLGTLASLLLIESGGSLLIVELDASDVVVGTHVGAAAGRDLADGVAAARGAGVRIDDRGAGSGQEGGGDCEELHFGFGGLA